MDIGLALPHYDFSFPDGEPPTLERIATYAARAEALGFASVWISDHLFIDLGRYGGPPGPQHTPEAMTMLAAAVAATERVRVGTLVLCAAFRNPAFVAQAARALGPRVELGIGAGWNEAEFIEAGIPFGTPGERIGALPGYLDALKAHAPDTRVFVGGKGGPRIARTVAEHADGWNIVWQVTPADYAEKLTVLEAACARAGRDPASVRKTVGLSTWIGDTARLQEWAPKGTDPRVALGGSAEEVRARAAEFEALGVDELILTLAHLPFAIGDDDQLGLAARALL